jgi:hypothetical protein
VGSLVSIFGVLVFFCVVAEIFLESNFFFQYRNAYVTYLHGKPFIPFKSDLSKNLYVFPKYNFFHKATARSGLFLWRDSLHLAKFFADYHFFILGQRHVSFNVFARALPSSVLFFNLLFRRVSVEDSSSIRKFLVFTFSALALNKYLKIRSNRFFFFFLRLVLKERKLALALTKISPWQA